MADIKIICDASYDDTIRFTGFAGGIYASEGLDVTNTYMYSGVAGEHRSIQEGEFEAILVGLNELSRYQKIGSLRVDSLEIYSDSKNSIATLHHWNDPLHTTQDPKISALLGMVRNICGEHNWQPVFKHVNAHISYIKASGIERLNSIADKNASRIRLNTIANMLHPNTIKKDHVTILVPPEDELTKGEAEALYTLGYSLIEQGRKIRVYSPHLSSDHPFCIGVMDACVENDINPNNMLKVSAYNAQGARLGLNMTLYRYHMKQQGQVSNLDLQGTPGESRAAQACELIYGKLSPSHMGSSSGTGATGRLYEASHAVYDFMSPLPDTIGTGGRPQTVQGWLMAYTDLVSIDYVKGLDSAYQDLGLDTSTLDCQHREVKTLTGTSLTTSDVMTDPQRERLSEIFTQYHGQLEKQQFIRKILDGIHDIGFPNDAPFNASMNRFLFSCPTHKLDIFVSRVLRHANKVSPKPDLATQDPQQHPSAIMTLKPEDENPNIGLKIN